MSAGKRKTLADELADLFNPAPKDEVDPDSNVLEAGNQLLEDHDAELEPPSTGRKGRKAAEKVRPVQTSPRGLSPQREARCPRTPLHGSRIAAPGICMQTAPPLPTHPGVPDESRHRHGGRSLPWPPV